MIKTTKAQRKALWRIYCRPINNPLESYLAFRKTVQPGPGCIMVPWCNMLLGIEPDGYTHS